MERRFERNNVQLPVDVSWSVQSGNSKAPAGVVDISRGGLRLRTGRQLIPGSLVHVFLERNANPFAYCRVVWAQTHGGALPSEAGLEILQQLSEDPWCGLATENPLPYSGKSQSDA